MESLTSKYAVFIISNRIKVLIATAYFEVKLSIKNPTLKEKKLFLLSINFYLFQQKYFIT